MANLCHMATLLVGSDGSPRSFTPSLGSCLGLSCFDLLVAQLEKAGPGFE